MTAQVLYRMYDRDGHLLYIGISSSALARFHQHQKDKAWYGEVETIRQEHYPDRASVAAAEKAAIMSERPRYNVVHNKQSAKPHRGFYRENAGRLVRFRSRESGAWFTLPLSLHYEFDGDPISDEYDPRYTTAGEMFDIWRSRVKSDTVRISWYIVGPAFVESAPHEGHGINFLNYFDHPFDPGTGELVRLETLPVVRKRWDRLRGDTGGFIPVSLGLVRFGPDFDFATPDGWSTAMATRFIDYCRTQYLNGEAAAR